ncbi:MAG: hypothetical protein RLZZ384_1288, partial [Pseudomonadota bacterium]
AAGTGGRHAIPGVPSQAAPVRKPCDARHDVRQ